MPGLCVKSAGSKLKAEDFAIVVEADKSTSINLKHKTMVKRGKSFFTMVFYHIECLPYLIHTPREKT